MATNIEVECVQCHKKFEKSLKRYNEAIKKGYKFLCSIECFIKSKTTSIKVQCSNCQTDVIVRKNEYDRSFTKRFFCNKSCSAIYNNKLKSPPTQKQKDNIRKGTIEYYKKLGKDKIIKNCLICNKTFSSWRKRNRKYCSRECTTIAHFGISSYTKDEVINKILEIKQQTQRTPQKIECNNALYHAAVRFFGTWNKTMETLGLKPNHSKYQKIRLKCLDGHMSDSISEKIIDDWLFKNNIQHERSRKYPNSNMDCDFYLTDYNIWFEYFGLSGGNIETYDNTMKMKEQIVVENKLKYIFLKPEHLYDDKENTYDEKLTKIFKDYLPTFEQ